MISKAGTTVASTSASYGAAWSRARWMLASSGCSPSTPSAGVPGCP